METTNYQFTAQQILEQEKLKESKTPIEEAFKVNYGFYPIVDETASEYDELAWNAFKKGYFAGRFDENRFLHTVHYPEGYFTVHRSENRKEGDI